MKVDLREDGVLWMINKAVFHPRGYALAVTEKGDFHILGDGEEVWSFHQDVDQECFEKFSALMNRL